MMRTVACDVCGGDGRVAATPAASAAVAAGACNRRTVNIQVPAGIADGQRIRLGGGGHTGEPGAPAGDLYVLIAVRPDERFIREDDDLVTLVEISARHAALGVTVEVPTLEATAPVEIGPGTQPGDVVVLRGRGMPRLRRTGAGDLRVVVNVIVPRRLTRDQRKLLQRLADSLTKENLRSDESVFAKLKRALRSHAA